MLHAARVGFLQRLDDRVIGQAERDPASRRRASAWANWLLLLIGVAAAIALYLSDHKNVDSPWMYVLIGIVLVRALVRLSRSRGR